MKKITFLIFIALIFSGCIDYKEVEIIEVTEVGVKDISPAGVNVEVAMQVKNPNNFNISIVDSDLSLLIKGKKMGTAVIKDKVTLKKKSNAIYRFTLHSSFKDLGIGGLPVLMGLMNEPFINVQIVGDVKAQAKGFSKKVPVDFTEKVKL